VGGNRTADFERYHRNMRILLDIADDVLLAVEERAQREKKTIGELLSELARPGLTRPPSSVSEVGPRVPLRSVSIGSTRPLS
jgi:hypothetical protein